jgi:hypothetical protein
MRKVTREVTDAFFNRRPRKCGNTRTDGTTIWLHGNAIARHSDLAHPTPENVEITLAGWDTVTTRERLNGIGRRASMLTPIGEPFQGFSVFRDRGVTKIAVHVRHAFGQGGTVFGWDNAIEMPHGEWINPHKFVGQFADK